MINNETRDQLEKVIKHYFNHRNIEGKLQEIEASSLSEVIDDAFKIWLNESSIDRNTINQIRTIFGSNILFKYCRVKCDFVAMEYQQKIYIYID